MGLSEKNSSRPWLAALAAVAVTLLVGCGDTDPDLPPVEDLSGSALQVSVNSVGRLIFQWDVPVGKDYYKLSVNPDGVSEFVELVGRIILLDDVVDIFTFIALASPEIKLALAEFLLESCLENDPADPDDDECDPLAVTVLPVPVGELLFQWEKQDGATHYRISIDPDGLSGYSILADFIPTDEPFYIHEISSLNISWADARFMLESCIDAVCEILGEQVLSGGSVFSVGIIRPPTSVFHSIFGAAVALSEDGNTLAVGSPGVSDFTCLDITGYTQEEFDALEPGTFNIQCIYIIPDDPEGDPDDPDDDFVPPTSLPEILLQAGAVSIYTRDTLGWGLHTTIEAPNREAGDNFGWDIGLSNDGTTLAVTAPAEDSASTGVGGEQDDTDNEAVDSGAAYVFTLVDDDWELQEYIKASNTQEIDLFGWRVTLSGDGDALAVSAVLEASADAGDEDNNDSERAGAVYTYTRVGDTWTPRDYLKAPDIDADDLFGISLSMNMDGKYLAIGAIEEGTPGSIDGRFRICNPGDGAGEGSVYMFERADGSWAYSATIKASNAETADCFGSSVDLNDDATRLAVGAPLEDSRSTGVNGADGDNDETNSGAAYLFERVAEVADVWSQTNYFKASNTGTPDQLGAAVRLSSGGTTLVAGAIGEASPSFGINSGQNFNTVPGSGAAYAYREDAGTWDQTAYIKPSIPQSLINFGWRLDMAMDGQELAVAAPGWELVTSYQGVIYIY